MIAIKSGAKTDAKTIDSPQRSFFGNAMWFSLGGFVMQGVGFAANLFFANILGAGGNGQVANYIYWQTLFTVVISWQINATINNAAITFGRHRLDEYIFALVRMCVLPFAILLGATLAFPGFVGALCNLPPRVVTLGVVNAGLVSLVNIASYACITLGKRLKYLAYTIGSSLLNVSASLGLIIFFRRYSISSPANGRILGYTLGWLPAAAAALYLMIRKRGDADKPKRAGFVRYALPLALPLVASEAAQVILQRSNSHFTARLIDDASGGLYSMANSIGGVGIMAAAALAGAWTPWYFRQSSKKRSGAVNRMIRKYIMFFAAFICGAMATLPDIPRWFFPKFAGCEVCLPPILICGFSLFLYNMVANYHLLREKSYFITIISVAAGALSIALSLTMIPKLGILGAAAASLICYLIQLAAVTVIARFVIKGLNIKISILLTGLLAVGLFAVFTYIFMDSWKIRWIAGALCGVYCLLNARRMMKPDEDTPVPFTPFSPDGKAREIYLFYP